MTLLGNPTRKRGIKRIFLAYASGYQVFKPHQFVLAALASHAQIELSGKRIRLRVIQLCMLS